MNMKTIKNESVLGRGGNRRRATVDHAVPGRLPEVLRAVHRQTSLPPSAQQTSPR